MGSRRLIVWALSRSGKLARAMDLYAFRRLLGPRGLLIAWRELGVRIEDPVRIGAGLAIPQKPNNVSIGAGSKLTGRMTIVAWKPVTIGRNVIFNDEVLLLAGGHDPDSAHFGAGGAPITIGDYAWLPVRVTVLPGVTIGEGAVIGSGAVVAKDVPPYGVAVGNPAEVVRERARVKFSYNPALGQWRSKATPAR
jgi:acetyltransferase-like isoleucine patch superfamily enzyme